MARERASLFIFNLLKETILRRREHVLEASDIVRRPVSRSAANALPLDSFLLFKYTNRTLSACQYYVDD